MSQRKEQEKSSEKDLNEMETTKKPDAEFEAMVKKMFKNHRGRMDDLSENLNKEIVIIKKEIEAIKKNQSEMKNTVSEMKTILEAINSRCDEVEN